MACIVVPKGTTKRYVKLGDIPKLAKLHGIRLGKKIPFLVGVRHVSKFAAAAPDDAGIARVTRRGHITPNVRSTHSRWMMPVDVLVRKVPQFAVAFAPAAAAAPAPVAPAAAPAPAPAPVAPAAAPAPAPAAAAAAPAPAPAPVAPAAAPAPAPSEEAAAPAAASRRVFPWNSDGSWPEGKPAVAINSSNFNLLRFTADGEERALDCVTIDDNLYVAAQPVCEMMDCDLTHGRPKSDKIRAKMTDADDIGQIRTVRRGDRTARRNTWEKRYRLYFTLPGLMVYVMRTKPDTQLSKDLTRWAKRVMISVYRDNHYLQPDNERLPILLHAARHRRDPQDSLGNSVQITREIVRRGMPPPPATQYKNASEHLSALMKMCNLKKNDLAPIVRKFLEEASGAECPAYLKRIEKALTDLAESVNTDARLTGALLDTLECINSNSVGTMITRLYKVCVTGVRSKITKLHRPFFKAAMNGTLEVRDNKPFLTLDAAKPDYNPENDEAPPKVECNEDFGGAAVQATRSGGGAVVTLDAATGNTTRRLKDAGVDAAAIHVPNPDANVGHVLQSAHPGTRVHTQTLGRFARSAHAVLRDGEKIVAAWADFTGGSRMFLPEAEALLESGTLREDAPVAFAVTFNTNDSKNKNVKSEMETFIDVMDMFKRTNWNADMKHRLSYRNSAGQMPMLYLRFELTRAA
jgi:hypothetical protein